MTNIILLLAVIFGGFSYPIVQQDCPVCVASERGVFTEYAAAREEGNVGLLAHDYLAGRDLFSLRVGDVITLVYSNHQETYRLDRIERYLSLSPLDPKSSFYDGKDILQVGTVFRRMYGGARHLTLQTCDGAYRVFYIATPIKATEWRY